MRRRGSIGVYRQSVQGNAPQVPKGVLGVVRELCLALPETTERVDQGAHWAAHSFDIRRRSFCLLLVPDTPIDGMVSIMLFCASPDEREMFLAMGHPFFEPHHVKKVGLVLGVEPDWEEIRELVTDSYCLLAPKKLVALVDLPPEV